VVVEVAMQELLGEPGMPGIPRKLRTTLFLSMLLLWRSTVWWENNVHLKNTSDLVIRLSDLPCFNYEFCVGPSWIEGSTLDIPAPEGLWG